MAVRLADLQISIHPPRAGRDAAKVRANRNGVISILAPRAGRDWRYSLTCFPKLSFQSTRPVRGATRHDPEAAAYYAKFQSTRPVRGATVAVLPVLALLDISIHAPRAGRDADHRAHAPRPRHFNPRAPCGARPPCAQSSSASRQFQSTRPVRGATKDGRIWTPENIISIHAPRAGRDEGGALLRPARERISIHAPRAGRDSKSIQNYFTHFCDKRQFLDNFTQNAAF